ncbi:unnamed protein product [Cuscuta epithymum]|uniref:Uncharacterized protein n=1 Tax=Cuscuta epithymum TaxID=186058 RepID=A0AAV0E598_9ASTE|nr:unnamed protein product [Cuscuta epithymum]
MTPHEGQPHGEGSSSGFQ